MPVQVVEEGSKDWDKLQVQKRRIAELRDATVRNGLQARILGSAPASSNDDQSQFPTAGGGPSQSAPLNRQPHDSDAPERPSVVLLRGAREDDEPVPVEASRLLALPPVDDDEIEDLARIRNLEAILGDHGLALAVGRFDGRLLEFTSNDDVDLVSAILAAQEAEFTVAPAYLYALNIRMKGKEGPEWTATQLPERSEPVLAGNGPLVVIIDTGLAAPRQGSAARTDQWLDGVVGPGAGGDLDPLDVMDDKGFLDLGAGHGTFIAGIVRQVQPNARVHVLRALHWDGYTTNNVVAAKLHQAAQIIENNGGRGVINLSLGATRFLDVPHLGLEIALDAVASDDIAIVASAGNSADTMKHWPAASDKVISVAGLQQDGSGALWSTRGEWVDFSIVAEGIVSTYIQGKEQPGSLDPLDPYDSSPDQWPNPNAIDPHPNNPNAVWLGSSFAAPQVAAWIATFLAVNPSESVSAAKDALQQIGLEDPDFGHKLGLGVPLPGVPTS